MDSSLSAIFLLARGKYSHVLLLVLFFVLLMLSSVVVAIVMSQLHLCLFSPLSFLNVYLCVFCCCFFFCVVSFSVVFLLFLVVY